jgi:hypothetical protein
MKIAYAIDVFTDFFTKIKEFLGDDAVSIGN